MIEKVEQGTPEWFAARLGNVTASRVAESTDQDGLKNAYKAAYTACNGNPDWQKKVIAAKDKVKAKL